MKGKADRAPRVQAGHRRPSARPSSFQEALPPVQTYHSVAARKGECQPGASPIPRSCVSEGARKMCRTGWTRAATAHTLLPSRGTMRGVGSRPLPPQTVCSWRVRVPAPGLSSFDGHMPVSTARARGPGRRRSSPFSSQTESLSPIAHCAMQSSSSLSVKRTGRIQAHLRPRWLRAATYRTRPWRIAITTACTRSEALSFA